MAGPTPGGSATGPGRTHTPCGPRMPPGAAAAWGWRRRASRRGWAPCDRVCPVAATIHDAEGLNVMVYNRCVGTRYCSNNCPYKVRRFNFLEYNDLTTPVLKLGRNPDVTVRTRGVMEKCTYCLQRLTAARIKAEEEGRTLVRDGEVNTACAAACPTHAITFGNLNDRQGALVKL